jgi:hypothetical protein
MRSGMLSPALASSRSSSVTFASNYPGSSGSRADFAGAVLPRDVVSFSIVLAVITYMSRFFPPFISSPTTRLSIPWSIEIFARADGNRSSPELELSLDESLSDLSKIRRMPRKTY